MQKFLERGNHQIPKTAVLTASSGRRCEKKPSTCEPTLSSTDDILDDVDDEAGAAAVGGGGGGRGRQSSSKKKKGSAEEKVRLRDDPEARAEMTEMFGQGI